jgi:hypothetical protein
VFKSLIPAHLDVQRGMFGSLLLGHGGLLLVVLVLLGGQMSGLLVVLPLLLLLRCRVVLAWNGFSAEPTSSSVARYLSLFSGVHSYARLAGLWVCAVGFWGGGSPTEC